MVVFTEDEVRSLIDKVNELNDINDRPYRQINHWFYAVPISTGFERMKLQDDMKEILVHGRRVINGNAFEMYRKEVE